MSAPRPRTARATGLLITAAAVSTSLVSAVPAIAVTGPDAAAGSHAYLAKLNIGDVETGRACTSVLVDPRWVLTAASCLAAKPGDAVVAGKPALKTTATFTGQTREVVEVSASATDRDLVLARLASPVTGIAPVKRAAAAPAAGVDLTAAGFGRTKTQWVTDTAHTGAFTTDSAAAATTLAITGKGADVICKGDSGGPLLNAAGELVGINSRSWQAGCLGAPAAETRTGAVAARTDNVGAWIDQTVAPRNGNQVSLLAGGGGAMWSQFGHLGYGEYGDAWAKINGKNVSRVATVRDGDLVRAYAIADGKVYGQDLDLASSGTWSGWGEVPGGAAGAQDISASLVGTSVHVQIVGSEGNLYSQVADYKAGRWNNAWTAVGASGLTRVTSAPAGPIVRVQAVSNGRVYGRDFDTRNSSWSPWGEIPGGATGVKDIASSMIGNNVQVQIIGGDGAVWSQFGNYDAGRWNDVWAKAGGAGLANISSAPTGTTVEVYATDAAGKVNNARLDTTTGSWSTFQELKGGISGTTDVAAAISVAPSKVTLAATTGSALSLQTGSLSSGAFGAQWTAVNGLPITQLTSADTGNTIRYVGVAGGKVYDREYNPSTNVWGTWNEVPGGAAGVKDISTSMINNVLYVQIVGSDGNLYTQVGDYNLGRWNSTWAAIPGVTGLTGLTSVKAGPYVRLYGIASGKVYGRDLDTRSNTWSVWGELPGGMTGAKDIAISRVGHTVQLQAIGADGALYAQAGDYLAGLWKPSWTKVGGTGLTRISSAAAAGNVNVYAIGAGGKVQSITFDTTVGNWTSWLQVPGTLTSPADLTATATK
ncbi:S1 family peptidase [Streptomyces sp. NBC_00193]|uniref:trypsin-like serine protease n=1 Tax=Streptomyces sp. NBC_00193 TaxID=2975675 RepID=UPI0022558423|nr:trypsin-like serine protease [Streptomyces sp. NBC_00193]MCX5297690.1 S1 family peptidase [Streptomyces sp. NBC_00193]